MIQWESLIWHSDQCYKTMLVLLQWESLTQHLHQHYKSNDTMRTFDIAFWSMLQDGWYIQWQSLTQHSHQFRRQGYNQNLWQDIQCYMMNDTIRIFDMTLWSMLHDEWCNQNLWHDTLINVIRQIKQSESLTRQQCDKTLWQGNHKITITVMGWLSW